MQLWNMLNGNLLKICSRESKDSMDSFHGGWVTDLHFSPDNKVLVSTGGYIKVYTQTQNLGPDQIKYVLYKVCDRKKIQIQV